MRKKYGVPAALAALVLLLDQISKAAVEAGIPLNRRLPVVDGFFNLVHVRNRGAAFGFLNRGDISWQFWLFAGFTLLAVILILFLIKKTRHSDLLSLSAFGAIMGGALGNFIDRLRFRYVTDFLDFHLGTFHWPAFNVADIALCYGVFIFALSGFFGKTAGDRG